MPVLSVLRRIAVLSVIASALAAPTVVAAGSADAAAAAPTCQGKRATRVGTGNEVRGTARRDVIVSGRSTKVYGGGGDDLICLTRLSGYALVAGGDGDDSIVVAPRSTAFVEAILGAGADTYRGGAGHDSVRDAGQASDSSVDSIATGPGRDRVRLNESGGLLRDRVTLGRSGGEVYADATAMAPTARLSGGGGSLLVLSALTGVWTVDNVAGTATKGGAVRFRWSGFSYFGPFGDEMTFRGSSASERIYSDIPTRAYLGGGNDRLELDHGVAGSRFANGGPGTDTIQASNIAANEPARGDIVIDVAAGTADFGVPGSPTTFSLFERHGAVSLEDATVTGTAGADSLYGYGCAVRIDGGAGADRIVGVEQDGLGQFGEGDDLGNFLPCDPADPGPHELIGGSSSDTITGSFFAETIDAGGGGDVVAAGQRDDTISGGDGDDVLDGGPGADTIDGGEGSDRCRGETISGCES